MTEILDAFHEPLVLLVFTLVWALCFTIIVRFVWQTFAPFPRSQFSFYITDIYALNFSLLPPLFLLREVETQPPLMRDVEHAVFLYLLAILIASELLGIFVARLHSIPNEGERMPLRLHQAAWIVGGALMGVLFLGVSGLITAFVLIAITLWPCVLMLLALYAFLKALQFVVRIF
jgi:hypothetical protein